MTESVNPDAQPRSPAPDADPRTGAGEIGESAERVDQAEGRAAKTVALIAHDGKKDEMIAFAHEHRDVLERYDLIATGTTGKLLQDKVGLAVTRLLSGPLGGDAQIAAQVAEGKIEAVFFFIDPLNKHPHDPDINALLRICNVHNVPFATNPATAAFIISQ
ncbi:MAG: methylglyoxal synthase, partial [Anaerolinea sp.]|nr:methylglyoxal synthase [Anaerolinea sp.]